MQLSVFLVLSLQFAFTVAGTVVSKNHVYDLNKTVSLKHLHNTVVTAPAKLRGPK